MNKMSSPPPCDTETIAYVPRKRFVLMLEIDGSRAILCGRFCWRKTCQRHVDRLNMYRGYNAFLIDTRKVS